MDNGTDLEAGIALLEDKPVFTSPGTLYVVATPIGRLVDISVRAIRILSQVDLIAAEDTRRSYILLNQLGIRKEVISNQKFNEHRKTEVFLQALRDGKSVAVISDAGTPCVSDPGNELVKAALAEGFAVVPVPGACAAVSALSVSGFDLTSFAFRGFFPKENTEKKEEIRAIRRAAGRTFCYYESPKRIEKTVAFLAETAPEAQICLCNDLTKTHERFYRGSPATVLSELASCPTADKGEYTLVLEWPEKEDAEAASPLSPAAALAQDLIENGGTPRDAVERLAALPDGRYKKNELKAAALHLKEIFGGNG
ncbi:MAG: 16S rRNA (cytidine(1402)-2'-O)-methyltransferase [Clostridia bacterium]|nr:16S rRNA (cytidine(1402)-2'-O)-methyltransferase [Clostridia bacterium]